MGQGIQTIIAAVLAIQQAIALVVVHCHPAAIASEGGSLGVALVRACDQAYLPRPVPERPARQVFARTAPEECCRPATRACPSGVVSAGAGPGPSSTGARCPCPLGCTLACIVTRGGGPVVPPNPVATSASLVQTRPDPSPPPLALRPTLRIGGIGPRIALAGRLPRSTPVPLEWRTGRARLCVWID